MAERETAREGYVLVRPNRVRAGAKTMKGVVTFTMVAAGALILVVTFAGWDKEQGFQAVGVFWGVVYLVMAYFVVRWNRGMLPIASGLAIIMAIFAADAAPGWFQRSGAAYVTPQTPWSSTGLGADTLGVLTIVVVVAQVALIVFAMYAFSQQWQVEVEMPIEEARRRGLGSPSTPAPA
jgi:hypothetical protein